jgi:hypothetical protein
VRESVRDLGRHPPRRRTGTHRAKLRGVREAGRTQEEGLGLSLEHESGGFLECAFVHVVEVHHEEWTGSVLETSEAQQEARTQHPADLEPTSVPCTLRCLTLAHELLVGQVRMPLCAVFQ